MVYKQAWSIKNYGYVRDVSSTKDEMNTPRWMKVVMAMAMNMKMKIDADPPRSDL